MLKQNKIQASRIRKVILLALCICTIGSAFSQVQLSAAYGLKFDHANTNSVDFSPGKMVTGPAMHLEIAPTKNDSAAFNYGINLSYMSMMINFRDNIIPGYATSTQSRQYLGIGSVCRYRIKLSKQSNMYLSPELSARWIQGMGNSGTLGQTVNRGSYVPGNTDTLFYIATTQTSNSGTLLLGGGIVFSYPIGVKVKLNAGYRKYYGFHELLNTSIQYWVNSGVQRNAMLDFKGNYSEWIIGISYSLCKKQSDPKTD